MRTLIFSCLTILLFAVQLNAETPRTNSPAYHGRHYRQFRYIKPRPVIPYSIAPVYPVLPVVPYLPSYAPRDYYGYPYGRYYYANPNIVFGVRF